MYILNIIVLIEGEHDNTVTIVGVDRRDAEALVEHKVLEVAQAYGIEIDDLDIRPELLSGSFKNHGMEILIDDPTFVQTNAYQLAVYNTTKGELNE